MKNIIEKIHDYALEELMGERFGKYSKYIIQDRAIPDVRDGLKPVQRRILYSMYINKNTFDKPTRKSAQTVGNVLGHFHPHGDTSVYDAMVRLSQDWKMGLPLVDMQGNNGSIDGDSAAAYRYTEARLAEAANDLLKDIDKNTVSFAPNFDDTRMEPTVLPAKFPNLLINGTTGISAGYATNIPPHNFEEIIDATIKRIDSPNCRIETILDIVKGPDFPTGGIAMDTDGIRQALTTGKGRVIVRAKTEVVRDKTKKSIVVTEIPYDVLKINIVKKIDEIRIDHKIEGITEVRDESDKDGLRITIDLKKEANEEVILNYLFKNTELQTSYNYNMVAIVDRRPKLLSIIEIIDAYIAHYKEVILNRTKFDLAMARKRYHIVEGLIKAISILDELIQTIRESKNKQDSKDNIIKKFGFTEEQAEAIVTLQLYRLSNTDIELLKEEKNNLEFIINSLTKILEQEDELHNVMKQELRMMKSKYKKERKTLISNETAEIKIDQEVLIPKEDVVTLVTKEGYIKRTSKRAYQANTDAPALKEQDYILGLFEQTTTDVLLLFTNLGNYLYIPVYEIPDIKWKVLGKHISNIIKIEEDEQIISAIPVSDFNIDKNIIIASRDGMIKQTKLEEFKVSRYSKPISCMKLKENDQVVAAMLDDYNNIMIATNSGYSLWFDKNEIPISGIKSSGVKSITLKNDYVINAVNFSSNSEYVTVFTDKNTAKRIKLEEFEKQPRARRGLVILKEVKTNPYQVIKILITDNKEYIGLKSKDNINKIKITEIPISDRYKTGSTISKEDILEVFLMKEDIKKPIEMKEEKEEIEEKPITNDKPHQISLLEIDDELKRIDDILK